MEQNLDYDTILGVGYGIVSREGATEALHARVQELVDMGIVVKTPKELEHEVIFGIVAVRAMQLASERGHEFSVAGLEERFNGATTDFINVLENGADTPTPAPVAPWHRATTPTPDELATWPGPPPGRWTAPTPADETAPLPATSTPAPADATPTEERDLARHWAEVGYRLAVSDQSALDRLLEMSDVSDSVNVFMRQNYHTPKRQMRQRITMDVFYHEDVPQPATMDWDFQLCQSFHSGSTCAKVVAADKPVLNRILAADED